MQSMKPAAKCTRVSNTGLPAYALEGLSKRKAGVGSSANIELPRPGPGGLYGGTAALLHFGLAPGYY